MWIVTHNDMNVFAALDCAAKQGKMASVVTYTLPQ